MQDILNQILSAYNWQGSLIALACIIVIVKIGKFLAFKVPALARMREVNRQEDAVKRKVPKYKPVIKSSQMVGLGANITFFVLILPFCITLQAQPLWKILLDAFALLMVYDFFYYLSHRFWFHGNGWMRRIHAVHHQARNPTHIDAFYVHPFETFVGLVLFMGTVPLLYPLLGPFHLSTIVLSYVVFVQINTINHTFVDLPYFPFKTLSWVTAKHHVHHENMHKGNYATITLLYDRLFGTLD